MTSEAMPSPLNVSAAPAEQEARQREEPGETPAHQLYSQGGRTPAGRTKIEDKDSSNHGSTAAAQAQVQALQDALSRGPQRGRDGCAQVGDTGSPHGCVGHTWETHKHTHK